jgi:hypothetical protein
MTVYTTVEVEPGVAELYTRAASHLVHSALPNVDSQDVRSAQIVVDSWVLSGGHPVEDPAQGLEMATSAVCTGLSQFYGLPDPGSQDTHAQQRWRPGTGISANAWTADNGMSMAKTATDPSVSGAYSYPTKHFGRLVRPGLAFDRNGYLTFSPGSSAAATIAFVLVPEHGGGPYYDILHFGTHSAIRYSLGRLEIWLENHKIISYQTRLDPGEPMIVVLALETAGLGRFAVLDRSRTTREFSTKTISAADFDGYIGASSASLPRLNADMTLLEVDYYTSALSWASIGGLINTLALVYGVNA